MRAADVVVCRKGGLGELAHVAVRPDDADGIGAPVLGSAA
jgi:hypothetical protein